MSLLGALFAGLAVLVWQPPWSWVRVRVDDVAVPRPGAGSALAVVAVAVTGSLVVLPAAPVIVGWTGLVIVAVGWRRARRSHGRKRRLAVREETQLIVDAVVAELRSGAPPEIVVRRLAAESALIEPAAVVRLDGAVESAIRLGVADVIADVVETGSTLRAAGLEVFGAPILRSEALLVRRADVDQPAGLDVLTRRLQGVLTAREYVLMDYDVPLELVEQAVAITPGLESPTVSPLHNGEWAAVRAMVPRNQTNRVMDALYDVGARAILVTSILACRI